MKEESIYTTIVKIEQIRVKDLYTYTLKYIASKRKDDIDFITKQRAYAHSNNPYANEDDIGMILAYIDNKCVGYLGLMPGIVRIRDKNEKIIWPTCMYISPEARGKSISTLMVNTALCTNNILVITGMGNMSEPIFKHLNFKPIKKAEFSEINFQKLNRLPVRLTDRILQKTVCKFYKKSSDKEFGNRIIYSLLKKWVYKTIEKRTKSETKNVIYKEIPILEESIGNKIPVKEYSFPRTAEWINWMLKFRWVLGKDEAVNGDSNYYFSNIRDHFKYVTIKFQYEKTGEENKFLIFSISQDKGIVRIKLLDHLCENEEDGRTIVAVILKYAKNMLADSIEIPLGIIKYFDLGGFKKILSEKESGVLFI